MRVTARCDLKTSSMPMANFNFNSNRLDVLEEKLSAFIDRDLEDDDDDTEVSDDSRIGAVVAILQDACNLIRDTDGVAPDFKTIIDRVDTLINRAVDYSYNNGELCDFMPSFAHSPAYPELPSNIPNVKWTLRVYKPFEFCINRCNSDYQLTTKSTCLGHSYPS